MENLYQTNIIFLIVCVSFVFIILNYSLNLKNKNAVKTKVLLNYIEVPTGTLQSYYNTVKPVIQPKQTLLSNIKYIVVNPAQYSGTHTLSSSVGSLESGTDILTNDELTNSKGYVEEFVAKEYTNTSTFIDNRPTFNSKRQIFVKLNFSSPGSDTVTTAGLYLVVIEYLELQSNNQFGPLNMQVENMSRACILV